MTRKPDSSVVPFQKPADTGDAHGAAPLMTISEVRSLFRFKTDSAVHKLVQRGLLACYRLGGNGKKLLFRREDVEAFLERSYRPVEDPQEALKGHPP